MYRTSDPRFRRRLNELGATVENATEQAQSSLYIFGQRYISPCLDSVTSCLTTCVDASCPSLNLSQRDRIRRQRGRGRGRSRGRAELSFDFYDDWDDLQDEGEGDGLLGWSDEFDRLLAGSGAGTAGYGSVSQQPQRQGGMIYTKGRRKSAAQIEPDPTVIPGSSSKGLFGRIFGGKARKYTPSAADLQEHPGQRRGKRRDVTEGEALLEEEEGLETSKKQGRKRSGTAGTAGSGATTDSYSSRGDIFPSDEEDAIPLDDEFAMVLERRNTNPHSGGETESSSGRTRRGKRPSAGSRTSTRRTMSSRSMRSSTGGRPGRSRTTSDLSSPIEEHRPEMQEETVVLPPPTPTLAELKDEESRLAAEEEARVERKRQEAQRLAAERGLQEEGEEEGEELRPSKEAPSSTSTATPEPSTAAAEEPSQLPTPLPTDDEEDAAAHPQSQTRTSAEAAPEHEAEGKQRADGQS